MKPSQKTSPRQIRDKKAITRSQWEFRQKTRKLPEARKNVKGLSAKKQNKAKNPKKNQFLALQLTIFNRTLLHLTHSPVPSTVNEEFLKKNVIYRNISPVKRKVEFSLNTFWVLGMMSCAGWVTCPALGSWCHGDANSCARSLSISVPRSLMMVITGAALRLSREHKKGLPEVLRVLVVRVVQAFFLDKENQELLWTAMNVLNYAISFLKKNELPWKGEQPLDI